MTACKPLPGYAERFVEVRGARLRALAGGEPSAPPVLLVHGLGGTAENWLEVAPALARRARVLLVDLPGHGESPPLPALPTLDALADRLALLARRELGAPAVVAGHSLGGLLALRLAARRPEAVAGLVLFDPAGLSSRRRRAAVALAVLGVVKPGRLVAPFRRVVARHPPLRVPLFGGWGASDPEALPPAAVEALLAGPLRHTDTLSAARALVRADPRPDLARVRCPALVVFGARDSWVPVDDGLEYARALGAPLRLVADCAHLVVAERPEACLDAIGWMLDRVRQVDEAPLQAEPVG